VTALVVIAICSYAACFDAQWMSRC